MKLYIPTSSLNFNNIFSTESISPYGFYTKRIFGNKRFYTVLPNNRENELLLYSKYPIFEIERADIENYPVVIEIETEDYGHIFSEVNEIDGVKVYICPQTIYLNPFHSRVYFGTPANFRVSLSKDFA